MKNYWCIAIMISMLFMSVDGAADLVNQGHPHGDSAVHQVSNLDATEKAQTADSEGDHCERCCHGHTASMTTQIVSMNTAPMNSDSRIARSPHVRNFAQAPPTPPPTA